MRCFQLVIWIALMVSWSGKALAQGAVNFPSKPVTIVMPYTAGGSTADAEVRVYQENLNDIWKHQVLVDYKPGASGIIANSYVAKAVPDGHTLLYTAATIAILPALREDLPYDFLKDLASVVLTTSRVFGLAVTPSFPANTYEEFIAYAKAKPGEVTWGTVGAGGALHMTGEWLASATGIKLTFVHYKGAAAPEIDLMAGRLHSIPKGLLSALPLIKSGKLKIIAIITGERTPLLPGVRTVAERTQAESGIPGFAYPSWVGLLAPGGTPPAIVDKLNADIIRAIKSPKAMNGWDAQGTVVVGTSPDGFRKILINELAQWKKLVKENNIKVD